jgi:hypothetical protein
MLKNYTSQVPSEKSIAMIEALLARKGATQTSKKYDVKGNPVSLCFTVFIKGVEVPFRLPARIDSCRKVLVGQMAPRSRVRPDMVRKVEAQAARTAWKIVFDWVEAQMAMIDLAQVDLAEVFLPYAYDASRDLTLYETLRENNFRGLLPAPKEGGV